MFAIRQAAAAEDGRLAPTIEAPKLADSDEHKSFDSSSRLAPVEKLQRADARVRGLSMLIPGVLFLLFAIFGAFTRSLVGRSDSAISILYDGLGVLFLLLSAFFLITAFKTLRTFTITANEQDIRLSHSSSGVGSQPPQVGWSDARGFVTFRVNSNQKKADTDTYYLLDTTSAALAWRITPKTPASVREAHERFVRMANEHVPLRDITASLKGLLESPETRSYEYAVIALSGPAPVPPAVRNVLTTPVRESHFLRGYLSIAAMLLALLVAAGLLLQAGVIPASAF
jgi:hypothetical protein